MFEGFPAHWSTLKKLIWLYKGVMKAASWVWKTVSGSLIHVTDALAGDVSALSVAINPVQSGSGDPAPDNVRPISGWSEVNVWVQPTHDTTADPTLTISLQTKNIFEGWFLQGYWAYANGAFTTSAGWICTPIIPCDGNTDYVASWGNGYNTRWQGFVWFDENKNFISTTNVNASATNGITGTSPANAAFLAYNIAGTTSSTNITNDDIEEFQIEAGTTSTAWDHPSTTAYRGVLDVINGTLTLNNRFFVADGTTIKCTAGYGASGANYLPAINLGSGTAKGTAATVGWASNRLKPAASIFADENSFASGNSGQVIVLHIGTIQGTDGTHGYNSASAVQAAANAWLVSNPLQISYALSTPIVYQLTPTEVSTLAGENYVWGDTGDISLTYKAPAPSNKVGTAKVGTAKAG